jgi:hypothetical protein
MRITMPDGRCACCGDATTTGGCARCDSSVTMCTGCGTVVRCGCGRAALHDYRCRAVVSTSVIVQLEDKWQIT